MLFRSRRVNLVLHGQLVRLSDIGTVTRAYADPPQPMFRVNGKPAIALGISMREGGNVLALGDNIKREMVSITNGLPIGIEPILVADQPYVVDFIATARRTCFATLDGLIAIT